MTSRHPYTAAGLITDVIGALWLAVGILRESDFDIAKNTAGAFGYHPALAIERLMQKRDSFLGISILAMGFALQFLASFGAECVWLTACEPASNLVPLMMPALIGSLVYGLLRRHLAEQAFKKFKAAYEAENALVRKRKGGGQ